MAHAADLSSVDVPFWKAKPEIYKKMLEERAIVVSVTHVKPQKGEKTFRLFLKTAGIVNAPMGFCEKKIQEYDKLPSLSKYIKETKFDAEKKELYFYGDAYTYIAKMWMKIEPIRNDGKFKLGFEVVRGHLTGMKGKIQIEDSGRLKSEMSLFAEYDAQKLPLPPALLDFGLEIVLKQVAQKIRVYLESENKKELF
mgnify:FL=1